MYKGLIDNLTFVYSFIAKGRGKLDSQQLRSLRSGADTLTTAAPMVLGGEDEQQADKQDYAEAQLINNHIDEIVVFQLSNGEII